MDGIVTADSTATSAGLQARDILIIAAVMANDPVGGGLVGSLGHPGRNVTGTCLLAPEMSGKRLELLGEIVPGLLRVAVLWSRNDPDHSVLLRETDNKAAHDLGIPAPTR